MSPFLPVKCLYLPSPNDTHIDLSLNLDWSGFALTIVPRGGYSLSSVSVDTRSITSASERSESAMSHSWDCVLVVVLIVGLAFQGIIHRRSAYGNLVYRVRDRRYHPIRESCALSNQ